jgi:hypothetical protein
MRGEKMTKAIERIKYLKDIYKDSKGESIVRNIAYGHLVGYKDALESVQELIKKSYEYEYFKIMDDKKKRDFIELVNDFKTIIKEEISKWQKEIEK